MAESGQLQKILVFVEVYFEYTEHTFISNNRHDAAAVSVKVRRGGDLVYWIVIGPFG